MKRKRILASFLAAVLLLSLLPAAFAAEADDSGTTPTTYTLTINNTESGYTYVAYQIFTGTLSGTDSYVLSDVKWGTGISDAGKGALATLVTVSAESDNKYDAAKVAEGLAKKQELMSLQF